jgi:hypothetical protein
MSLLREESLRSLSASSASRLLWLVKMEEDLLFFEFEELLEDFESISTFG